MPEVSSMRAKELKAELDERGVTWRGVAFEKDALEALVVAARSAPPPPPPPPESPAPPAAAADEGEKSATATEVADAATATEVASNGDADGDDDAKYAEAYEVAYSYAMKLKVKELRTELGTRSVGWADCVEKSELAARLADVLARASLFSRSGVLSPGAAGIVSPSQLKEELLDDRTPMLLDVFATWCGPCKMIAPFIDSLAAKLGPRARVCKLDADEDDSVSFGELGVQGLPTLIFYREGKEVYRLEGAPQDASQLEALAKEHLQIDV